MPICWCRIGAVQFLKNSRYSLIMKRVRPTDRLSVVPCLPAPHWLHRCQRCGSLRPEVFPSRSCPFVRQICSCQTAARWWPSVRRFCPHPSTPSGCPPSPSTRAQHHVAHQSLQGKIELSRVYIFFFLKYFELLKLIVLQNDFFEIYLALKFKMAAKI